MSEFVTVKMRCPACDTEFAADEVHGAVPVASDSDFRPVYEGPDPILTHMHTCPGCRYSAYREGFEVEPSDEDELIEPVEEDERSLPRPFVSVPLDDDADYIRRYARSGELASGLVVAGEEPFGATRYLLAARVHEFIVDDADPLATAHYYLRAAWSARSERLHDVERDALREVLLRLCNLLESEDEALAELDRLRLSYLAAETARRSGDFGRALEYFAKVEAAADMDEDEGLLLATLSRRQRQLAAVQSDVNAQVPREVVSRRRAAALSEGDAADETEFDDDPDLIVEDDDGDGGNTLN